MTEIEFESEMIRLKDLLKATGLLPTGGLAKDFIREEGIVLNGERCFIAGKKLYKGDRVLFNDTKIKIV